MTRRLLAAVAAELPESCRAAYPPAVAGSGLLLGLWAVWFTPLAGWLA